jgi:hypothetical protein
VPGRSTHSMLTVASQCDCVSQAAWQAGRHNVVSGQQQHYWLS